MVGDVWNVAVVEINANSNGQAKMQHLREALKNSKTDLSPVKMCATMVSVINMRMFRTEKVTSAIA